MERRPSLLRTGLLVWLSGFIFVDFERVWIVDGSGFLEDGKDVFRILFHHYAAVCLGLRHWMDVLVVLKNSCWNMYLQKPRNKHRSIIGLVVEFVVAIDEARVRFTDDA